MIGRRFGHLEVTAYAGLKRGKRLWASKCHGGGEFCKGVAVTTSSDFSSGRVNSCGCLRASNLKTKRFKHGKKSDPAYNVWISMNQRCTNPRLKAYLEYGGRGISVCARWSSENESGFINFLQDMGQRPNNTTIDRIDNDTGYFPENCRWASRRVQRINQRPGRVIWLSLNGKTQCLMDWATELGIDYRKISYHLRMKRDFAWIAETFGAKA